MRHGEVIPADPYAELDSVPLAGNRDILDRIDAIPEIEKIRIVTGAA
jgi:hypothetical protein